jgi:hypothetical protein
MAGDPARGDNRGSIQVPAPTPWPMILAFGITLAFAGIVTAPVVTLAGIVLIAFGSVGWFREVLPVQHHEEVAIEPEPPMVRSTVGVGRLRVGQAGHRASLPLEIYPYSAGIKGGIAGGVVMAAYSGIYSYILHGSLWFTMNLLAATALPSLAHASRAELGMFNAQAFIAAILIHGFVSVLIGLLYGVLLPMLPSYPVLLGGVAAPLLWSGLLHATLRVISPVADKHIEWRWFIVGQVLFGLTAGIVVAQTERIRTLQHMTFAERSGMEFTGMKDSEDPR